MSADTGPNVPSFPCPIAPLACFFHYKGLNSLGDN